MQDDRKGWWIGLAGMSGAFLLVIVLGWRLHQAERARSSGRSAAAAPREFVGWRASHGDRTAKEIVAAKVEQFGENRRKVASALAARAAVQVPDDVKRFFDAVQAQDW